MPRTYVTQVGKVAHLRWCYKVEVWGQDHTRIYEIETGSEPEAAREGMRRFIEEYGDDRNHNTRRARRSR